MDTMIQEFKDFISKGDVVKIAVGLVLAAAFGSVVASFTDNILMSIIAIIFGEPSFRGAMILEINDAQIAFGSFLTDVVNFLLIALALYFTLKVLRKIPEPDPGPSEKDLLAEIAANTRR